MILPQISWGDAASNVADVIITAYIVYGVLLLIRGTRAVQILIGLLLVVALRLFAQELHLWTVYTLVNGVLIASGVAIPIVFQPEIRRALAQLGRTGSFDPRFMRQDPERLTQVHRVVAQTASILARGSIGAIFVFERNTGLGEFLESGTRIDAEVSAELLLSIFTPRSPLHDGAVIIRRDRVVAAGCFLPLSDSTLVDRRLGTRHRAALGICEQTDAVALVISEENSAIVLVQGTRISEPLGSPQAVTDALASALHLPAQPKLGGMASFFRTLWSRHDHDGATNAVHTTELRS